MKGYLELLKTVLTEGEGRPDRTGEGTRSIFGTQTRYDLREGFPLVTTKKVNFSAVVAELLWFLRGETNIQTLGSPIWTPWADETGNLGPIYGAQWRSWGASYTSYGANPDPCAPVLSGIDQITEVIYSIQEFPESRRHIVSAWNVEAIPDMALPPCHVLFQFYVSSSGYLDCQLYQRSADLAIGVPFNIASYALLLSMVANETGLQPRYFIHSIGDAHIYRSHFSGVETQLARTPFPLPRLHLTPGKPVLHIIPPDISLTGYEFHPPIPFKVAV